MTRSLLASPVRTARRTGVAAVTAFALASAWPNAARAERVNGIGADAAQAERALSERPLAKLAGGTLTLGSLKGNVVVVNFWASWCAPCRRELPRLQALDAEIASRGGRVIAVSIDEDRRNVELFARRNGLTLPVLLDGPDGLARALDLRAVPLTIVLDRSGRVAYATTQSSDAGLAALANAVRPLLTERPVAANAGEGGAR